jgi:DnaJ homolog subfamily C member 19
MFSKMLMKKVVSHSNGLLSSRFRPFNKQAVCAWDLPMVLTWSPHDDDYELKKDQRRATSGVYRINSWPNHTARQFHSSAPTLYHATEHPERSIVTLTLALGAFSAAAYAASSAVKAYNEWQASRPIEETKSPNMEGDSDSASQHTEEKISSKQEAKKQEGKRENIFSKWFNVGGKYYEGGFEEIMTRREAALILGIRESSSAQKIKEAHRRLLILNHPDTGGSTYIAGKINEAKELLLKGKVKS